jgi:SPP1 family predicted phage head-tail adaptor
MIGDMKHKLTLQEKTSTPDEAGGYSLSWTDVTMNPVVYAAITVTPVAEKFMHGQLKSENTCHIRIRWRGDVHADMRLTADARVYNIISVADPAGDFRFLDILARME